MYTLKEFRTDVLELGPVETSRLLGIKYQQLNKWENAGPKLLCSIKTVQKICKAYGCECIVTLYSTYFMEKGHMIFAKK